MSVPKFHIKFTDNFSSQNELIMDINVVPYATIVYLSKTKEISINERARLVLGISDCNNSLVDDFLKANKHLLDIKIEEGVDKTNNDVAFITLLNGTKVNAAYSFTITSDDVLGKIFFITFHIEDMREVLYSTYTLYMIKNELLGLKNSLDNNGKEKLNEIMKLYFGQEDRQLSLDDLLTYEKELEAIHTAYPVLSRREVLMCVLLAYKMDLVDIASITNRSLNSVFVTIHRINRKLEIPSKNELYEALRLVIAKQNKKLK